MAVTAGLVLAFVLGVGLVAAARPLATSYPWPTTLSFQGKVWVVRSEGLLLVVLAGAGLLGLW